MGNMVAKDTKPSNVSEKDWDILWNDYSNFMQKIYDMATSPGFAIKGKSKYNAINNFIKAKFCVPYNIRILALWRDQLLSTTQADPTPKLTPNNITRNIVVCKG